MFEVSLFDILKAYGDNRRRVDGSRLRIEPSSLFNISDAILRSRRLSFAQLDRGNDFSKQSQGNPIRKIRPSSRR